jgi:hypothetical protein
MSSFVAKPAPSTCNNSRKEYFIDVSVLSGLGILDLFVNIV